MLCSAVFRKKYGVALLICLKSQPYILTILPSVVQIQACRPHVVHHNVFSGPRKHSGEMLKSEICWKMCEITFLSLNCLRWTKCICTRTMNSTFSVYHFVLFIYFTIKLEGMVHCLPTAGEPVWITSVFLVPWHSLSWRIHLAQWTQQR